ncbi:MAG: Gfo/Idh/MocA family oxidoreductase [Bacteroidetes bacterium]|nr:Gfo/Idh/MocA family oxidoreductase [Bacteroidota bacterium]MBS1975372.1 Gfo/Idh/MocA family oxidoreductase [Bacteroidota bacterium]
MPKINPSRRKFLQQLGSTGLLLSSGALASFATEEKIEKRIIEYKKKTSANDKINVAVIGMGIMGHNDIEAALKVPGVQMVAACDLYKGRLQRAKEVYGNNIFTSQDYRELLERKDIDAVIIATADLWHSRISIDAMNKGKAVYCEKPMVHKISQGLEVIAAQQRTKKTMQVGSQRVSSIAYAKAKELYKAGEIGQLTCIEANFDRQSALGAWEYTMPTDGSPATVDWDRYIAGMPKRPYDAKKFFWWRNYKDFGTGVAGDLFVHLLSGVHLITGSKGPEKIFASGQLAYWKDGRDVPDVMTGIMHYPETPEHPPFELMLRVNFISGHGEAGSVKLFGSEGVMEMGDTGFIIHHHKMSKAPGIGGWDALYTYPKAMQDELLKTYNTKYSPEDQKESDPAPTIYEVPKDYDEHVDHFANFFEGVRTGKPVVEGPVFGFRAAAPCLAANASYFQKKIIHWDPESMKIKETS